MRMKVWGEISGERHLVGTLETIPGREEQFSYAESYLENEAAQPLSVLLPLREEPFPKRQTRVFFRNLLPEGGAPRRCGEDVGSKKLVISEGAGRPRQRMHRCSHIRR